MSGSKTGILAGIALIVALAVASALYLSRPPAPEPKGVKHFRDVGEEAGITWRMRFLPGEQGEVFKINLYDHGSGLAIGDYDGDGHDDVYFVNQLGANALYRNNGDGNQNSRFEHGELRIPLSIQKGKRGEAALAALE